MIDVSDLVGIPYLPHGRDEKGLDCFGLIWLAAFRIGKPIPDVWYRGFDPSLIKLAAQMNVHKVENCSALCIIEMLKDGRLHLGLALDAHNMIHATTNDGVIVETIGTYPITGYWAFD